MLIATKTLTVKRTIELTPAQTQVLVNAEPFLLTMGLAFELWCIACRQVQQPHVCEGGYEHDPLTGRDVFTVACQCSTRIYTGTDILPPDPPHWTPRAATTVEYKREKKLTREQAQRFTEFEQCLRTLNLQYALYCLQCRSDGNPSGIHGAHEAKMECACTTRLMPDAPVTVH